MAVLKQWIVTTIYIDLIKNSDGTYWKCEIKSVKPYCILYCSRTWEHSSYSENKAQSQMHYSISTSSALPTELWNVCQWTCDNMPRKKKKQQRRRLAQCNAKLSSKYASWYLETDISPNGERNFRERSKTVMLNKMNQQAKKRKKKYTTTNERLRRRVPGTIHKIKSVVCTIVPWVHMRFKYIQICCISQ